MKLIFYTILALLTALAAFQVYTLVSPGPVAVQNAAGLPVSKNSPQTTALGTARQQTANLAKIQRSIIGRNLFNVEVDGNTQSKKTVQKDISQLEKTTLKIALMGTVTTKDKNNRGWAILKDLTEKEQGLYQVNDTIQNGMVKAILRNKIILSVNGKDQVLEVSTDSSPGKQRRALSKGPGKNRPSPAQAPENIEEDLDAMAELTGDIEPAPEKPLFKTRTYYQGKDASGVMVYGIRRGSPAQGLGLRNGDVIQAVNDIELSSPGELEGVMEEFDGDSDVTVSVLRRGKSKQIVYSEQDKSYTVNDAE